MASENVEKPEIEGVDESWEKFRKYSIPVYVTAREVAYYHGAGAVFSKMPGAEKKKTLRKFLGQIDNFQKKIGLVVE